MVASSVFCLTPWCWFFLVFFLVVLLPSQFVCRGLVERHLVSSAEKDDFIGSCATFKAACAGLRKSKKHVLFHWGTRLRFGDEERGKVTRRVGFKFGTTFANQIAGFVFYIQASGNEPAPPFRGGSPPLPRPTARRCAGTRRVVRP